VRRYRGEDPAAPIKALHRMAEKQVRLEMAALPLICNEPRNACPFNISSCFAKHRRSSRPTGR
jgi:hypothetical protein